MVGEKLLALLFYQTLNKKQVGAASAVPADSRRRKRRRAFCRDVPDGRAITPRDEAKICDDSASSTRRGGEGYAAPA